ncbi:D-glycero-beta-D-manno-heptose 1-phosphate adenylyltransferase [Pedobacter sp. HMWF019]|uniref:D-glycero-beta-D-manno-heptose 1-phosphate adenylyltransferase n=1 Tax=Pedobacter sp. HMWF019 TaxID=2056856 RepID=UPI000D37F8B8|nr:D-glycero-beta-D-manno-heptose 1-phosphate adenylyltransferase [Pedobacter sp. HMWF019]PTS95921.1 D-glycero-beta-D-manno-heptose 1-phosphate adenylyltransferase [Pedobacter sp. HMWF019]
MINNLQQLTEEKIFTRQNIRQQIEKWKAEGQKIVFTNGVFDLLHIGHISYLLKTASFGNKLIIGLNADSSVKRLKGDKRPINTESSRAILLAAMFFTDAIIIFDEDTPLNLIKDVLPDVLVKGADYKIGDIVGGKEVQENGGEVRVVDFVSGYSSTNLIQKISGK